MRRNGKSIAAALLVCALALAPVLTGCGAAEKGKDAQTSPEPASVQEPERKEQAGDAAEAGKTAAPKEEKSNAGRFGKAGKTEKGGTAEYVRPYEDAYAAYLQVLREQEEGISNYDWQRAGEPRSVNVLDICGDETPELILIAAEDLGGDLGYCASDLKIYTYENGAVRSVYDDVFDVEVGGGFYYVLFQLKGGNSLYAYKSYGDEWWTEEIACFVPDGGELRQQSVMSLTSRPNEDYSDTIREYLLDGTEVDEETFGAEWDAAVDSIETVVMRKEERYDFQDLSYMPGSRLYSSAMGFRDAVILLKGADREATRAVMERGYRDGMETAVLYGVDDEGDPVWNREFSRLEGMQISGYWDYGAGPAGYLVGLDGIVACIDVATGEYVWTYEAGRGCGQIGGDGSLYLALGEAGNHIVALDVNGSLLFDRGYAGYCFWGGFAFTADGNLCFYDVYDDYTGREGLTLTIDGRTGEPVGEPVEPEEICAIAYSWDTDADEYVFRVEPLVPDVYPSPPEWSWYVEGDEGCWELLRVEEFLVLRPLRDTTGQVLYLTADFYVEGIERIISCRFTFLEKQGTFVPVFNDAVQWDNGRF